jgi:hypothetical protein
MKIASLVLVMTSLGLMGSRCAYAAGSTPQQNAKTGSRASLVKENHPKRPRKIRERSTQNVTNVRQMGSSPPAARAAKIAHNRPSPLGTTRVAALGGQQFARARSPAAAPATIGGPAKAPRSTAAIKGTTMNRRHVN